jgi:Collagen triple helix repeat (20 copies)
MIVAVIALFVALGGTGYAALKLPKGSVGRAQLRKNAVISSKVKNGSLRAVDFAKHQLPAGPRGGTGPRGTTGARGRTGTTGKTGARGRTGTTGAKGSAGATGPAGPAGTARAYGVVKPDGSIVAAKSKNLTVSHVSAQAGTYCVTPTAASGIDAATVQPVATVDSGNTTAGVHIIQSVGAAEADDCAGGWEFVTTDLGPPVARQDIAFTVSVP